MGMTGADGGVTTCTESEPHALSVRIEMLERANVHVLKFDYYAK